MGHLLLEFDRLMFNFPHCISTCSLWVSALEYWQLQYGLPYGRVADTIITVWVPVLCVTVELGLWVPIWEYQQLQHGFPYCGHSFTVNVIIMLFWITLIKNFCLTNMINVCSFDVKSGFLYCTKF